MITLGFFDFLGTNSDPKKLALLLQSLTEQKAHELTDQLVKIDLFIVDEPEMKKLHSRWMRTAEVTDVLSFPVWENYRQAKSDADGLIHLGDIVICHPVAQRQAAENNRSVEEEIAFLVEHAGLHLLGFHHK